jgi:hypothetical protein
MSGLTLAGRRRAQPAVLREIAAFRTQRPNDTPVVASKVQRVQKWFRFSAHLRRPDGAVYSQLEDFGELAPDGTILRIVTFPSD